LAIGDCRLPIHGLPIADWRFTDWRLPIHGLSIVDWDCRLRAPQSAIGNRQSESAIGNRQSAIPNRQSAIRIGNPLLDNP